MRRILGSPEGLYRYHRTVHYTFRGIEYTWGCTVREDTREAADKIVMNAFEEQHSEECVVSSITN